MFLEAGQRWRLPGGCPVYPAHAPALCLPWHSRYSRLSRCSGDSSELLRWTGTRTRCPLFFRLAPCAADVSERLDAAWAGRARHSAAARQSRAHCRRCACRVSGMNEKRTAMVLPSRDVWNVCAPHCCVSAKPATRALQDSGRGVGRCGAGPQGRCGCWSGRACYNPRVLHGARRTSGPFQSRRK